MINLKKDLTLPEGIFKTNVLSFDEEDREKLFTIYMQWRKLCDSLDSIMQGE